MKASVINSKPYKREPGVKYLPCFLVLYRQVFYCTAFSQKQDIKFEYLGIEAGLSHNTAFCMLQDSRGFMWFGTSDGLNKYDGYQFTVYKNDAINQYSLGSNSIKQKKQ